VRRLLQMQGVQMHLLQEDLLGTGELNTCWEESQGHLTSL